MKTMLTPKSHIHTYERTPVRMYAGKESRRGIRRDRRRLQNQGFGQRNRNQRKTWLVSEKITRNRDAQICERDAQSRETIHGSMNKDTFQTTQAMPFVNRTSLYAAGAQTASSPKSLNSERRSSDDERGSLFRYRKEWSLAWILTSVIISNLKSYWPG